MSRFVAFLCTLAVTAPAFGAPAPEYSFSHFVGSFGGGAYQDAAGSTARLTRPQAIAVDRNGNIYVGEFDTLRRISVTGKVSTFLGKWRAGGTVNGQGGSARVSAISGIAIDSAGNIFIAETDACVIRKITPAGAVSDFAGSAPGGCATTDGLGTAARLNHPAALAIGPNDTLYFSQPDNVVRAVTSGGNVTTLAGSPGMSGTTDATGASARFSNPHGLAVDSAGNVFVADTNNCTIRRITTPGGVVTTFAGLAGTCDLVDATGASARFLSPTALAIDSTDTLYELESAVVRKITSGAVVTTLAGSAFNPGYADGIGPNARFVAPQALTTDRAGSLLIADTYNNAIRKLALATNAVTTFAGAPVERGVVDSSGSVARFDLPRGIASDYKGNLYVTDTNANLIRKITPAGFVSTFAGSGSPGGTDGIGTAASFYYPIGITYDSVSQHLYVADSGGSIIRAITLTGVVTTLAGSFLQVGHVDGSGIDARFNAPEDLTVDGDGNIYVTDYWDQTIRIITPTGDVKTLAGSSGVCGSADGQGTNATFCFPRGIAYVTGGDLFVADGGNHTIRRVTTTGGVTTYAGGAGAAGTIDGTGVGARFSGPLGIMADSSGTLFVTEGQSNAIRKITTGAVVTTINGFNASLGESVDGTASQSRIVRPEGMTVNPSGDMYLVGSGDAAIDRVQPAIADVATVSTASPALGSVVQLDTLPSTATSWTWTVLRRPTGSIATLSNGSIRNPTFTPDIADVFTFLLKAESVAGVRYSMVDILATGAACFSPLNSVTVSNGGASSFCPTANGGTASVTNVNGGLEVSYRWGYRTVSGGAVTDIPGANTTSYTIRGADLGGTGARFVVVTVTPACGPAVVSNEIPVTVLSPPNTTITAPASVQGLSTGNTASIADAGVGATYAWTISGGSITAGGATRTITFSVRNSSPVTLNVTATSSAGCASSSSQSVTVNELPYTFQHLAGTTGGQGSVDGTGSGARLRAPAGIAVDRDDVIYFADAASVRKLSAAGRVSTLAGLAENCTFAVDATASAARFSCAPNGVTRDSNGNVYVMDNLRIRKITPAGVVTTLAGSSNGTADGTGTAAQFTGSGALAIDSQGNIFVADTFASTIRKVTTPGGVVTTFAGLALNTGTADGNGSSARFSFPRGIAIDSSDNLYITDFGNQTIRKITPSRDVTTIAGTPGFAGSRDGAASSAQFVNPFGIAVDAAGNLFVSELNGHRIRQISSGQVTTLAGQLTPIVTGYADGTGSAARFTSPGSIAIEPGGSLVVSDTGNSQLRRVTAAGVVTTITGAAAAFGSADGSGAAALLNGPFGIALAADGSLYFSDGVSHLIRKVTLAGVVTTIAGSPDLFGSADGNGSAARFNQPGGAAVDGSGNVYVCDRLNHTIRRITPSGDVTTVAGQAGASGSADGNGNVARFFFPTAIVINASGEFLIADRGNSTIRKMTAAGDVTTLAGQPGQTGTTDGSGAAARFSSPSGLALDVSGNLFVADTGNNSIRKVTPAGAVTTVATLATGAPGAPSAIAVDRGGDIYVASASDSRIIKFPSVSSSAVSVGGDAFFSGSADGTANLARFRGINSMIIDGNGVLYIAEGANQCIRVGRPTPLPDIATGPGTIAAGSAASLDVAPQSASTWNWTIIRRPAGSVASFSNPSLRNPTLTPDMPDLYILMVRAENIAGVRFSTVNLMATGSCSPTLTTPSASVSGATSFCENSTGGVASVTVTNGAESAYRWGWRSSVSGVITDIKGANAATYQIRGADLGGSGIKYLVVTVTPACGTPLVSNNVVLSVLGAPDATITAPSSVNGFSTGNTASVPDAGPGASYVWNITNATITAGASTRTITFTAANYGPINLDVTVTAGGCTNSSSTSITIAPAPYDFEHLAGSTGGWGYLDGSGPAPRFGFARGIAMDGNGVLYIPDLQNNVLRSISRDGSVRTVAGLSGACGAVDATGGAARLCAPNAVTTDSNNNVYVAGNGVIRKVTPTGVVTTVAGVSGFFGIQDGTGSGATFGRNIYGLVADASGNLFVADTEAHTIRKIAAGGVVTTFAGLGSTPGEVDGTGTAARFNQPRQLAIDSAGTLYVADFGGHTIRSITSAGVVTTVGGAAGVADYIDGPIADARFHSPEGIALDAAGNIYVSDNFNRRIRKISSGIVTTIAGGGTLASLDSVGTAASFQDPASLARDRNGELYVMDNGCAVRKVTPAGVVTTFSGAPIRFGYADGAGAAARFLNPNGVTIGPGGDLFVTDRNNVIRRITPSGVTSTFAGSGVSGGADATGTAASFSNPTGIAKDSAGNLYVVSDHTIRKITPAAEVTTLAGLFGNAGWQDGSGSNARFNFPAGVAVDSGGNIFVADRSNQVIRKITPNGDVTTLAGTPGVAGLVDGPGATARFNFPGAVVVDSGGNILVADGANGKIRRVTPSGVVTTLAPVNSAGAPVTILSLSGMAIDAADTLYVTQQGTTNILRLGANGVVRNIGGVFVRFGATDGSGTIAQFNNPIGITADSTGETLYIADWGNHAIRVGKLTHTIDLATTSASSVATGTPAQLDTSPQGATSWSWTVVRQPSTSAASPQTSSIRNPTFTPDAPDLYTIMLRAAGPGGVRYSLVDVSATGSCTLPASVLASINGATTFCASGSGGIASVAVTGGGSAAYRWGWRSTSGGTITDIPAANGASYAVRGADLGGTGARFLVATVVLACGPPIVSNEIPLTVSAPPSVTITAPALVPAKSFGWIASVPDAGLGATYAWTISLGQITAGSASRQVTFSSANESPITLSVTVTAGSCTNSGSTTVTVLTNPYTFSVMAGSNGGSGYYDGAAAAARVYAPLAVVTDRNGNTYFSDSANTIRKISANGVVSTLAGLRGSSCGLVDGTRSAARFCYPEGLTIDSAGNLFVADTYQYAIRKITPDGVVSTIAGGVYGGADGTGAAAQFTYPYGITVDASGTLFLADLFNHSIRQITQSGVVTTLAGSLGVAGNVDGTGSNARFSSPRDITYDGAGNFYVADFGNNNIRRVTAGGVVTTIAGSGSGGYADGTGASAMFNGPNAIALDNAGNVIVADDNNSVIRRVTPSGVTTTVAGIAGSRGNENGPAGTARFNGLTGVAVDAAGSILVADYYNSDLRRISGGNVSTFAGLAAAFGSADGTGTAAQFNQPFGVTADAGGNLVVSDTLNNTIRKITPAGAVTTFAGTANSAGGSTDGTGPAASFAQPRQAAIDSSGNVYVTDSLNNTIRKITPGGLVSTFAGIAGVAGSADGGPGVATFYFPLGITIDPGGNLYVTDYANATIRKITPAGVVSTIAGHAGIGFYADGNGSAAFFNGPHGITIDAAGNLYVADAFNHRIRKITPAGDVSTLAGLTYGWTDGPRTIARFNLPTGVAVDSLGVVYVADRYNHRVRKVTPDGTVTTIAGQDQNGNADGTGALAMVGDPSEIALDANGVIYIADITNHTIHAGRMTPLMDSAVVNNASPATNSTVALDSSPQTGGTTYSWSLIRRSAVSGAELTSTSIRNPNFTPDIADFTTFLLRAENGGNVRYSTVDVTATGACTSLSAANASVSGATSVCAIGSGGTASVATTGGAALSYRWGYRNVSGGAITDILLANASSYVIRGADFGGAGTKFLVVTVTPACGSPITSNETTITIQPALSGVSIAVSGSTTVSPTGTGGTATLSYTGGVTVTQQWGYRTTSGGTITNISGQTGITYMINGANFLPGAGTYYLVATATPGCGAVTTSNEITVLVGLTIATNVVAASNVAGTSIHITWNAAVGASSYDVQKKVGASFTTITTTSNLFFDDAVTPDGAYLYRIHTGGGDSANTFAGTFLFTDAPLTNTTPIRIVHFTELRNAAAAMRTLAGILPFSFTDPTLTNSTPIRRIHLIEIRQAVDEARSAMSVPAISYGELAIQAGVTTVKVSHIQELRSAER